MTHGRFKLQVTINICLVYKRFNISQSQPNFIRYAKDKMRRNFSYFNQFLLLFLINILLHALDTPSSTRSKVFIAIASLSTSQPRRLTSS